MNSPLRRLSNWAVNHPVWWALGLGLMLVLLGFAFKLAPIVIVAGGAVVGVLNIVHARRRGYCPLPTEPGSQPAPEGE